jgi:hypothetical protein
MTKVALDAVEMVADETIPLVQEGKRLVPQTLTGTACASVVVPPTPGDEARISMKKGGFPVGHRDDSPVMVVRPSPPTTPSARLVSSLLLVDQQLTDTASGDAELNTEGGLPLIQAQQQAMVLILPLSQNHVRRSIRLKIKGLNGGVSKSLSHTKSSSILMAQFPFARFTHDEIVDLFSSFRIQLGKDELQRDKIISGFQKMPREKFQSVVN